jgi:hypothetical protein
MAKATRVYITPPTNTSAIDHPMMFPPRDPTRRRFLTVAAGASFVGAGSLTAAAMAPNVPQAVVSPRVTPQACPELRVALRDLVKAHALLIGAQAADEESEAIWTDWEAQNP